MLRTIVCTLLAAGLMSFAAGCTVIREVPQTAAQEDTASQEIALSRKLLEALLKNDAQTFVGLLPAEMQERFTEEHFKATRKSVTDAMGEPIEFSYVTCLELPSIHPQIWKVRFRRTNLAETKEFTSEVLFKVLTGSDKDGKPLIVGFQFI